MTKVDAHPSSNLKIVGIIPARYGSTRFPGKPLVPIAGKTLIQRTYENALLCSSLQSLVVATDDDRIFEHVAGFGGHVVMTSSTCLNGTERLVEVLKTNPRFDDVPIIVNIQGDEPCLDPLVTQRIVEVLLNDPVAVMSTAVIPFDPMEDGNNPSIVKCVLDQKHNVLYFSRALIPSGKTQKSSDHIYYRHVGIYAYRRDFLLRYADLPATPLQLAEDLEQLKVLEHGFRIKAAIVDSSSMGVDTPDDIQKVEQWLCKQNTFL